MRHALIWQSGLFFDATGEDAVVRGGVHRKEGMEVLVPAVDLPTPTAISQSGDHVVVEENERARDLALGLVGHQARGHRHFSKSRLVRHRNREGLGPDVKTRQTHGNHTIRKREAHGHALGLLAAKAFEEGVIQGQAHGVGGLLGGQPAGFKRAFAKQGLALWLRKSEGREEEEKEGGADHWRGSWTAI